MGEWVCVGQGGVGELSGAGECGAAWGSEWGVGERVSASGGWRDCAHQGPGERRAGQVGHLLKQRSAASMHCALPGHSAAPCEP